MALRVKCKCGKVLNVSSKLADKRISCPGCQRPFTIPLAKFSAAVKPGLPAVKPATSSAAAQPPPIIHTAHAPALKLAPHPAPEPVIADLSGTIGLSSSGAIGEIQLEGLPAVSHASAPPAVDVGDPVELSYARHSSGTRTLPGRSGSDQIGGPKRGFWRDLGFAFAYPFSSAGNAIQTLVLVGVLFASQFICIISLLVQAYVIAIYMNVISDTAAGHDDLKAAPLEDGFLDGLVKPWFYFVGSFLIAMSPGIAYGALVSTNAIASDTILFGIWAALGAFLWPIIVLLLSLSSWSLLLRPDLILATIFRTIGPYLAIWAALLVTLGLRLLSSSGQQILTHFGMRSSDFLGASFGIIGGAIIALAIDLYFTLVSMRMVGLYYLHFKHRFAFKLE
ncbi:MAG TPA: hypothetical protein VJZ71_12290 [Phycisphaerae bacterium]|nr:hypothetical protein [Phycisphaerae bacterium]